MNENAKWVCYCFPLKLDSLPKIMQKEPKNTQTNRPRIMFSQTLIQRGDISGHWSATSPRLTSCDLTSILHSSSNTTELKPSPIITYVFPIVYSLRFLVTSWEYTQKSYLPFIKKLFPLIEFKG